jgi:2-keto-4-pentenoate hydratase/2-oxohepta-3-ene-1,7-dioic acid hydratase in catechol pathway
MIELIERWDEFRAELEQLAKLPSEIPLDAVRLLAPIARPSKLFGIGLNYADHIAESGMERPTDQTWFSMPPTAANGPFDPISLPRVSAQLDYEAELVVVVGKPCRYADRASAEAAIFGYCVGNDVSIRDWQFRTSQFVLGKSFDTHAPHGPWIVTKDEIDAANLDIRCWVNGELRQSSNTRHMIFDPAAQVEHLSQVMTLEPGDLLFTGTPDGVGAVRKPPLWLAAGDHVRTAISGIGEIENVVVAD